MKSILRLALLFCVLSIMKMSDHNKNALKTPEKKKKKKVEIKLKTSKVRKKKTKKIKKITIKKKK